MHATPHLLAARAALRAAAATLPVVAAMPKLIPTQRAATLGIAREAHAAWLRALNVPSSMRLHPLPEVMVSDVLASVVAVDVGASQAALSGASGLSGVASRFIDTAAKWALSLGSRLASFAAVAAPVVARVAVRASAAAIVGIALYHGVRHFTLSPARGPSSSPLSPPRPALIDDAAVAAATGSAAMSELLMCPIAQVEMVDPVVTHDGFTYERTSIEQWFSLGHRTSPMTGLPLASLELTPNFTLAQMVAARQASEAAMPSS